MKVKPHFFISIAPPKGFDVAFLPTISFSGKGTDKIDRFYIRIVWLVFSVGILIDKRGGEE